MLAMSFTQCQPLISLVDGDSPEYILLMPATSSAFTHHIRRPSVPAFITISYDVEILKEETTLSLTLNPKPYFRP
jgi:hypothetical protein